MSHINGLLSEPRHAFMLPDRMMGCVLSATPENVTGAICCDNSHQWLQHLQLNFVLAISRLVS